MKLLNVSAKVRLKSQIKQRKCSGQKKDKGGVGFIPEVQQPTKKRKSRDNKSSTKISKN